MKIGIMARSLKPPLTGIGRYTLNLANHIQPLLEPEPLTLFLTREADGLNGLPGRRVVAPVPTPHEALRAAWEHTFVPIEARRLGIDVYHSPNYTLPLTLPCPSVVTVHDLAFLDRRFHNTRLRLYLTLLTKLSLRRAARVIAVSEYTCGRLEERFPFLAGRVSVVYNGLDPSFTELLNGNGRKPASKGRPPYVLFVGSLEPRKNLPRLIRAFERAMKATSLPHDLVLCGPWGWRFEAIEAALRQSPMRQRIRRVGYVPAEQLPAWYAGADLLAYPSLDEGFGFPVLEAMAAGTPVLTSDRSALPEVAGDAAVTVAPTTDAIAEGMARVLTDTRLAGELRERGKRRAAGFRWDKAAVETVAVYHQAVGAG